MFCSQDNSCFLGENEFFSALKHPMAGVDFMRQDICLPLKKGKKMMQYLQNNQTYVREIIYLPKERGPYGKN